MLKILFVSSEVHPFIKTGGLADVSASLPHALAELGHDVRILMPGYADALEQATDAAAEPDWTSPLEGGPTRLLRTPLPESGVPVWMLESAGFSDRPGNPYLGADGHPHPDNAFRFDLLGRAATAIAGDRGGLEWQPDVVHCNDWQTGLVPVRMLQHRAPGATVYTIHNLAYQGLFPAETFQALGLPDWLWTMDGLEFHGQMSFMKGGAAFADRLTTVSPSYAAEIRTLAHGWGLEGLFNQRAEHLVGILNGIDRRYWDPQTDPYLYAPYSRQDLSGKAVNKARVQAELGLPEAPEKPLVAVITRLADQKGIDLILNALPDLRSRGLQVAILGKGDRTYERSLEAVARHHPEQIGLHLGFDEGLAHRLEAGADMLLMPSRFEPCGLNQLYSLAYGTIPVVRAVGGLADSVEDATPQAVASGRATGISFTGETPAALVTAVERALALYAEPETWRRVQATGMAQDFTWERSAARYVEVYEAALADQKRV
ncbi:glycogen synthase GlgA [Thiohalorhabdus sp.]|uniref:glycogen synthase GlgA n=1 Tax=Thiohalorhabdus sp. TaxID=3094134 RepID=UPI002FC3060F